MSDGTSRHEADSILQRARKVLRTESEAIESVRSRIGSEFVKAVNLLHNNEGRLIITGMGKSGTIGKKLAETFSSTGVPAYFMHPAEGLHGDLGMIKEQDLLLMISYSGYTNEVRSLLEPLKRIGPTIIALTGEPDSQLADEAHVVLDTEVKQEAGPLNLAPTASTTATLALGDALAMLLVEKRDFAREDFARYHPGGSLGKKLMMQVEEVMYQEDEIPLVEQDSDMKDVLIEMTEKRLGITGVLDEDERLVGCVTDGDLRRVLNQSESGFFEFELTQVMTRNPLTVKTETDAVNALRIMEEKEVTVLFVENDHDTPVGVVHLHDLVQEGLAEEEDELPERSSSIDLGSFLFLNVPFAAEVPLLTCFEMSLGCVA